MDAAVRRRFWNEQQVKSSSWSSRGSAWPWAVLPLAGHAAAWAEPKFQSCSSGQGIAGIGGEGLDRWFGGV